MQDASVGAAVGVVIIIIIIIFFFIIIIIIIISSSKHHYHLKVFASASPRCCPHPAHACSTLQAKLASGASSRSFSRFSAKGLVQHTHTRMHPPL